jgi:hypothetical protein
MSECLIAFSIVEKTLSLVASVTCEQRGSAPRRTARARAQSEHHLLLLRRLRDLPHRLRRALHDVRQHVADRAAEIVERLEA